MSSSTEAAAQHGAPPSPTSLLTLPRELQARIVTLACLSTVPVRHIETKTTFSLMLVSRSIYALAAATLYRNLHITRASVLEKLQRTFASRPALGQLVHSLHLGPDNHLPDHWWPMKYLVDTPGTQLSLREMTTSLEDEALLPRWCSPRRSWALNDEHADRGRRDYYVLEAIEVAQMSLDVKLKQPRHNISSRHISSASWLIRVMEAQAALDLYLMEMRRIEDRAGGWVPRCDRERFSTQGPKDNEDEPLPFYRPLVIISSAPSPSDSAAKVITNHGQAFILHRQQLIEHLTRRNAVTDHLDHPLLAARSSVQVLTLDNDGRAKASKTFWRHLTELCDQPSSPSALLSGNKPKSSSSSLNTSPFPPTATAEGIVAMARSVLSATTRLQHLRLTGFLQQSLCGREASPGLLLLRSLALGPSSLCHASSLSPCPAALPDLEKLFFIGHELAERKVAAIATLPKLAEVYWDLTHFSFEDFFSAIRPLSSEAALAQPMETPSLKRSRSSLEETSTQHPACHFNPERNPPLVQLSIHEDSEQAMRSALSPSARAAWDEHRRLSETPYRIEIVTVASPNLLGESERWDVASEEVFQAYWESENAFEYFLTGRWPWDCGPDSQVA